MVFKIESTSEHKLDYDPIAFLRCHSRNKDPADVQTQVWQCAFEPSLHDDGQTTSVVASCGGNSVCFIDCHSGQILNKYYVPNLLDLLFSLAWTTLECNGRKVNILSTGGSKSTLHFINRSINKCILEFPLKEKKAVAIHALHFHPDNKGVLFCGTSNGVIRICSLEYNLEECSLVILTQVCIKSEVFDFAFCSTTDYLFASCNDGLYAVHCQVDKKTGIPSCQSGGVRLGLPDDPHGSSSRLVDSVEALGDGRIAVKCALHASIYIFDLRPLVSSGRPPFLDPLTPTARLAWSDTDNYFMYMGLSTRGNILACGDDKGSIWVYDISDLKENQESILPTCILPWPQLTDRYGDRKRKLDLGVYDIVIDKVAIHSSAIFLAAVTNNNMVSIWKRVQ